MFTVKAGYSDDIELRTSIDKVREFFADVTNFAELMPGIEQIHMDANGIAHWRIQAQIPLVGQMLQNFAVELAERTGKKFDVENHATGMVKFQNGASLLIEASWACNRSEPDGT